MDDRARIGLIDDRGILANAVIGFHLEAPPVRPHRGAGVVCGQQVGHLVSLDGVMEGRDPVAELLCDVEHDRHLVAAVAVIVNEDFAVQDADQGLQLKVADGGFTVAVLCGREFVAIIRRRDPGGPVAGDVAHTCARGLLPASVHPLRVLATRHLQRVRGAGKLHVHDVAARDVLERHAAAPDQIGRAGEYLQ